jgi:hypothetical protein
MKIFFDVDGVLIDGWHANSALRKPWDATLEADLGINREAFQMLFFGTPGSRSTSPMFECVTGRSDLRDALADVLPQVGYQASADDFMRYWFERDSNVNAGVFRLIEDIREGSGAKMYVATGKSIIARAISGTNWASQNTLMACFTAPISATRRRTCGSSRPSIARLESMAGATAILRRSARDC